jgi:hypothetical protein
VSQVSAEQRLKHAVRVGPLFRMGASCKELLAYVTTLHTEAATIGSAATHYRQLAAAVSVSLPRPGRPDTPATECSSGHWRMEHSSTGNYGLP